ncbi:glutathione S-transferase family protein [Ovoidimarina sediminis]|uniref:glutathione S-transferase family protein n=1 Tax=Ovoidimarina sediminis TaxID=3079856 RepID=UPI00290654CC|nr:glutathione S-transferase family protein [Rhodophyticola sp. MJ-SS7]MDU8946616.1 glutathione S-transferase family protein [Rhodophyticola sp. MJ-SS7]
MIKKICRAFSRRTLNHWENSPWLFAFACRTKDYGGTGMYTLHWEYMAGSIVVQAILEEMDAPYRLQHVDMAAGEHKMPEYRRLNPAARVPALTLPDGGTIGESAAIVVVLGERSPETDLVPRLGTADRSVFFFWLNVMATSGYMTVARKGHPERYAVDEEAIAQVEQKAAEDLADFFDVMEDVISGDGTFLESGHTALDLYLTMLTEWSDNKDDLFRTRPSLARLTGEVSLRPGYQAAMRTHRLN